MTTLTIVEYTAKRRTDDPVGEKIWVICRQGPFGGRHGVRTCSSRADAERWLIALQPLETVRAA
jgi:hypothetical protein